VYRPAIMTDDKAKTRWIERLFTADTSRVILTKLNQGFYQSG